jgi:hypothetical protein
MIDAPPSQAILPAAEQAVADVRNGQAAPIRYRQKPAAWQWVDLKGDCAGGRVEVLLNPGLGLLAQLTTTAGICAHLHELIRTWNLEDAAGKPLPVSPAGVGQLDTTESAAIMDAWSDARELSKRH